MKNEAHIKQLIQMNIGQIKNLKKSQNIIQDVVEQQEESIRYIIEQEDINEQWAEEFIKGIE